LVLIRLLGPVDVVDDDGTVHGSTSAIRQTILSLLAVHAGQVLSADWLLEHAWDGNVPRSGAGAVRFHIKRLRGELTGLDLIETHPGGYRLRVEPDDVDIGVLESLARSAADETDPASAVRMCAEALALWRGEPFLDASPTADLADEAARLDELRIAITERLFRSHLDSGAGSELVADLLRLATQHPLRESLWSMLITAQYRAGLQTDALRSYEQIRAMLAQDLGLDPSTELQDLQRRVLQHDPSLVRAPLRSPRDSRRNLPVQLSPLIGRRRDISELQALLATDRVITLIGAAGVGKTRLALAVAAEAVAQPGGVWWVELAAVSDPEAIGRAVLAAVGVPEATGLSPVGLLTIELGDEPSLLVLDNCEHLVDACAEFVMELLTANPTTSVLATSREPLGVPGEITWRVPSLSCPPLESLEVEALAEYAAVALFLDRAHRARPSFTMSEINASAVVQICHRLDGIPLALELAAVRCRQMSVERIATELNDRFRLLTGGPRTLVARQQTVEASVDWSYDLLDVEERSAFRRLGVFVGRFPMEAAEAVVSASGGSDASAVFDLINRLVDKSLVVVDDSGDGNHHYRLLETLRAYALDRLRAEGEEDQLRTLHAAWWADWLGPRGANPSDASLDEIDTFYDNLTAALDWSTREPHLGLRLLYSMAQIGQDLGRAADVVAAADRLLTQENADAYGQLWLNAAGATSSRYDLARGFDELLVLVNRMAEVSSRLGDEYHLALARFHSSTDANDALVLRDIATLRNESFVAAVAAVIYAEMIGEGDPARGAVLIDQAEDVAAAVASRIPGEYARRTRGRIARDTGDLRRSIELARTLTTSRSPLIALNGVRLLADAGLLACDGEALRFAVEVAESVERSTSGNTDELERARHRLAQLESRATSRIDGGLGDVRPSTVGTLWLLCREAIDAGGVDVALGAVQELQPTTPHANAVRAAIEAAATGNEDRWHEALCAAADHGLRLIAVDALEGLAVAAADNHNLVDCLRISAAAARLREETSYQWRFPTEQVRIETARTRATAELADLAEPATAEGRDLEWREAAAHCRP
jgi:predicted ATPase/DNA-binding SARP family transcriptional activator